ncbi:hypothetical protein [Aliicoccus persicus]|uniref:Uncharacterized protein n=1 Tax=Aliicoccus persicus TaxID=930138 RepID=A0A662Z5V6_9STAP|nr:hypothetical protein [Aliicoccus persicus]SEW03662.1 hypothetical protein SAMN05192557_1370 [Aliicoccus persicus]
MKFSKKVKIAAILSETEVIINAGSLDGIQIGQTFYIIDTEGRIIKDPDTDSILGKFEGYKGKLIVKKTEDRFSYCETPTYYKSLAVESTLASSRALLNSLDTISGTEQDKLNIVKEDILDLNSIYTDTQVMVGDSLEYISN